VFRGGSDLLSALASRLCTRNDFGMACTRNGFGRGARHNEFRGSDGRFRVWGVGQKGPDVPSSRTTTRLPTSAAIADDSVLV